MVDTILNHIEAKQQKRYVFNKTDLITKEQRKKIKEKYKEYNPLFVSAITGEGIDELKRYIMSMRP